VDSTDDNHELPHMTTDARDARYNALFDGYGFDDI
jgi:hypothetical protein